MSMKTKEEDKLSGAGADTAFECLRCADGARRSGCAVSLDLSLRDIAGSKIMCSQIKELWSDCPRSVHTYTSALRVAPCGVLQGAESVPYGCLMQAHELSLLSLGRDNITTPNYSLNTHAPDQTGSRSRVLHCDDDLTALDHYYHNPTRFS